jgi:alkaline phosphatase D
MRTAHLLTARVGPGDGSLALEVRLGVLGDAVFQGSGSARGSAGLLVGSGVGLDYRSAALVHHSWGPGGGLFAGIDGAGRLFVRDFETEADWLARGDDHSDRVDLRGEVHLSVAATPTDVPGVMSLTLHASDAAGASARLEIDGVPAERLTGSVALVSNVPDPEAVPFWFDDFRAGGVRLVVHSERSLGPVVGIQHTLSRRTMKLTAQFMPLGADDPHEAELEIWDGAGWTPVAMAPILEPGYTATFRVEDWDDSADRRVRVVLPGMDGFEGLVPGDPADKAEIVVAALTGNHNVAKPVPGRWSGVDGGWFPWDWGVWFPHADIVRHVEEHEPDFLFFSGDQVYEGASPTAPDREHPYLDYLYRWYLWHWAFSDLTRRLPTVSIPDDHDVYHGNVWGAGGIATPAGLDGAAAQDAGGYRMPAEFVRMVERTQTSHLPDSPDPAPVAQGIGVYFTDILYGGVSFAVIEDRKFKSAPGPLLPEAQVVNGWAQNGDFDAREDADAAGAVLLGERQLAFLDRWALDWTDGTWMKVVLSQTLFANLATLPASETSDANVPTLRIVDPGEYPTGDLRVADMDSNGWPQSGRDRALRAMRRGFAVHLAGDQHLGSTIQYGIDGWEDAAFALCVPSIANFFPRRWFPPRPGQDRSPGSAAYTGRYIDGFGNRMTVHAVSNPVRTDKEPAALHDLAPGYGIARFNRSDRRVRLEAWPRWADPAAGDEPYPGWPVEFDQLQGYGRTPAGWLPELRISGAEEPVVRIVDESSGEVVYTLRIQGDTFVAPVFAPGSYTAHVGEPGTDRWTAVSGLFPGPGSRTDPIDVRFR